MDIYDIDGKKLHLVYVAISKFRLIKCWLGNRNLSITLFKSQA
jgi:hypothetical protein